MATGYLQQAKEKNNHKSKSELKLVGMQPYMLLFFIILFIACVVASTFHFAANFLPPAVAEPYDSIVTLFNTTTALTGLAFFLTQILLFGFAFWFRKANGTEAAYIKGFLKLELMWTLIPSATFIFLFLWGQVLWANIIAKPNADALEIEVVAEQFVWRMRYPGADQKLGRAGFQWISSDNPLGVDISDPNTKDDFVPVQMHIPKNRQVKLVLRSKDVVHSFYVPYFHAKMDAVPGMTTNLHFAATTSTAAMRRKLNNKDFDYEIACAELCGKMHFAMKFILVVDEPEDFDRWYREQKNWASTLAWK